MSSSPPHVTGVKVRREWRERTEEVLTLPAYERLS